MLQSLGGVIRPDRPRRGPGARPVSVERVSQAGEAPAPPDGTEVGVGPWEGEWPEGDHWDPDLLADGDRRNVVDKYRYWRHEAIVADLDSRRHDFRIAIEN